MLPRNRVSARITRFFSVEVDDPENFMVQGGDFEKEIVSQVDRIVDRLRSPVDLGLGDSPGEFQRDIDAPPVRAGQFAQGRQQVNASRGRCRLRGCWRSARKCSIPEPA